MFGNLLYRKIFPPRTLPRMMALALLVCCSSLWAYEKTVHDIEVVAAVPEGSVVLLESAVRSQPGRVGQEVRYPLRLRNLSNSLQHVILALKTTGFEAMPARLEPAQLTLEPNQTAQALLSVTVVDRVAIGGQEVQIVEAAPEPGLKTEQLTFITVRARPHPYILVTDDQLMQIREKVNRSDWAQKNLEQITSLAERWTAPEARLRKIHYDDTHSWQGLFAAESENAWKVALAGKLTDTPEYLAKAARFLKNVCDPESGYPRTHWATYSNAYVHEGEFFLYLAAAYDLLFNEPILSQEDHQHIQETLRLFLEVCEPWLHHGGISNWVVTPNAAAICISLVLQDMISLQRHLFGPGGFEDQITMGVMGDGWFYECTANYSYLVAEYYGYAAHAAANWGFDLFHLRLPARYPRNIEKRYPNGYLGMNFDLWGPPGKNTRGLKDLYDGAIGLMNENGYAVASNDSGEIGPGNVYELAYRRYRDPAYAWAIGKTDRTDWPSLVYGVDPLPAANDPRASSAKADNLGMAALRSQTPGRTAAQQIQAFLKWGTHGGWHGHFDRTDLLALYRYGRSFYHPTVGWFGYTSAMYKAWIQPSVSHNMVVVDQFQQEPVESDLLLFYPGQMMQACAVQTNARWTQIPFWDPRNPEPAPDQALLLYGPDDEPVLQRRLLIVTDDYLVLADCLQGRQEHTYDWLLHPVGFRSMDAPHRTFLKHTAQADPDPQGSYKHILDCDWFDVTAPVISRFQDRQLFLDIHTLWPQNLTFMLGTHPVYQDMFHKSLRCTILGDNHPLLQLDLYTDLLEKRDIDIPLDGVTQFEIASWEPTPVNWKTPKSLALGDPHFVTRDHKIIFLADLLQEKNLPNELYIGRDQQDGEIQIVGQPYPQGILLPLDSEQKGIVLDLAGQNIVRFRTAVGVDYPLGPETDTRRTLLGRTRGTQARFLTIIEPHDGMSQIKHAQALNDRQFRVEMKDGRTQTLLIENFYDAGTDITIHFVESRDDTMVRSETYPPNAKEKKHVPY